MRFRPYVASIALLLLTTSAVGCQYLLPQDDPDEEVFPIVEVVVAALRSRCDPGSGPT